MYLRVCVCVGLWSTAADELAQDHLLELQSVNVQSAVG